MRAWSIEQKLNLGIAIAMAVVIIIAFGLEYGLGVRPCPMCWWQRYVHWVIGFVALVGFALPKTSRSALWLIIPLSLVGQVIALWQQGAQVGWWAVPQGCTAPEGETLPGSDMTVFLHQLDEDLVVSVPRCDQVDFMFLDVSLAGWNVLLMGIIFIVAVVGVIAAAKKNDI